MRSGLAAELLLALMGLVGWPAEGRADEPVTTGAAEGDFAGLVTVPGGRRLYLECRGSGAPTVVFEAGLRSRGDVWTRVMSRVAPFTHACLYDRPGTLAHYPDVSRSDPVPMPRSTGEVVADLHALLATSGVPGPYVLVGASTGGLIARQYASLFPAAVGGAVLVDAISEAMEDLMKPAQFARYDRRYLQSPSADARRYEHLEAIEFRRSFAEVKPRRRVPRRLPVTVLSAQYGFGRPTGVSRRFAAFVNRVWKRSQLYLASLHPGTKRVIAAGSGHQIHVNRPGLVGRYVLRMVARVRGD
jgi:pimeloyl-ACP methyl ester carboxylesterase